MWYDDSHFSLDNPFEVQQTSPEVVALTNSRFGVTRFSRLYGRSSSLPKQQL
jgi:hypothetical protein